MGKILTVENCHTVVNFKFDKSKLDWLVHEFFGKSKESNQRKSRWLAESLSLPIFAWKIETDSVHRVIQSWHGGSVWKTKTKTCFKTSKLRAPEKKKASNSKWPVVSYMLFKANLYLSWLNYSRIFVFQTPQHWVIL